MRKLTEKEKNLCKALIAKDKQEQHQVRLEDYKDYPFKIILSCLSEKRSEIVEDLNEAIALLMMLKEKGMISFIDSKSDECFGDNTPKMYGLNEPEHSAAAMVDYFNTNTWQLLNSYYYISNSFKDYCNDFKTIEQRRHEKEIRVMKCTNIIAIITAAIALLTLLFSLVSCIHQDAPNYITQEIRNYNTNKEITTIKHKKTAKERMADSTVCLSFQGISLGQPLNNSLKNAQKNKRVWNIKQSGNITTGTTCIILLAPDKSLSVDFKISTYNDTVYYIEYKSSSDIAFGNIAALYEAKYGVFCEHNYDKPDATYNPNNSQYYTWKYSNQEIYVAERDYIMELRDIQNKDKEYIEWALKQRDHTVYVHYADYGYLRKAHVADSIKREKEKPLREKEQRIQDSINKIKEEKRKNTILKQI